MVAMAAHATTGGRGIAKRLSGTVRRPIAASADLVTMTSPSSPERQRPVAREIRRLTALATPAALTQLSSMLLWTVDVLMVGRVCVDALNAVSLGRLWIMG